MPAEVDGALIDAASQAFHLVPGEVIEELAIGLGESRDAVRGDIVELVQDSGIGEVHFAWDVAGHISFNGWTHLEPPLSY